LELPQKKGEEEARREGMKGRGGENKEGIEARGWDENEGKGRQ